MITTNTPNPTSVIDVAGYLHCCSEGFDQVAAILKTIETEAPKSSRLRTLAGAGRHIADDIAELAGCWQEEVEKNGVTMK